MPPDFAHFLRMNDSVDFGVRHGIDRGWRPNRRQILVNENGAHTLKEIVTPDQMDSHREIVGQDLHDRMALSIDHASPRRSNAGRTSALLRKIEAGRLLGLFAGINMLLLFLSMTLSGNPSGWSLIAVGLFNSIMFPTIFALTLNGLGSKAAEGAGLLCMAIVGGAVIPLATGAVADAWSLTAGLCVPFCCYGVVAAFGFRSSKPTVAVLPDHQASC
jgi:hypothetical protein